MPHTASPITQPAQVARRRRRTGVLRPASPAAVAVTVSLLIGGAGFADAATGGTFLLGRANHETSTASLADAKGTPLALSAPHGKPPLAVNQNVMVKNLNVQYLGGLTATGLATAGGQGFTAPATDTPISSARTVVARTGKLPAGLYYVTATAMLEVAAGDGTGICWIAQGSVPAVAISLGQYGQEGIATVAETAAVPVHAGHTLVEACTANGNNGSVVYNAGIIAIRVLSSHG